MVWFVDCVGYGGLRRPTEIRGMNDGSLVAVVQLASAGKLAMWSRGVGRVKDSTTSGS